MKYIMCVAVKKTFNKINAERHDEIKMHYNFSLVEERMDKNLNCIACS